MYFLHSGFWAICACPEKQSLPWIHCIEYIFFINQDFWATCACPEKQSCLEFFTVLKYFLSLRIFEQRALALTTEFALEIFKPGGCLPPVPPPTHMLTGLRQYLLRVKGAINICNTVLKSSHKPAHFSQGDDSHARGVTRLDGAQGKKQVWRPHVRIRGL